MNKSILFLLFMAGTLSLKAQVTFTDSASTNKKEKKVVQAAGKRALAFYDWYLRYRKTNQAIPTAHAVIDQNTTARMKHTLADNRFEYDVFLANRSFDDSCLLEIIARKIEKNKITLQGRMKGKYANTFHIEMIIQQESWRIDTVAGDEDMTPSEEDKG